MVAVAKQPVVQLKSQKRGGHRSLFRRKKGSQTEYFKAVPTFGSSRNKYITTLQVRIKTTSSLMLLKWVKVLLVVGLASLTISLMLFRLDVTSAAFSLGVNFGLMFWFTIVESQLRPTLNSSYFNAYPFEKQGKFYQLLGIEWYRVILIKSGWEKIRQKQTPISKDLAAFQAYERASRVAEVGHLVIGSIVLLLTGYVLLAYSIRGALWLILSNLILNAYPILLQRYTRPRLRRILDRLRTVKTNSIYT
jgi:hypothetical protein